jgi:hypothetical protein
MRSVRSILTAIAIAMLTARPAAATFHLMQVEQAIGGVNGNTDIQGIQLRMRGAFQDLLSNARLFASDAAGLNPVLLASPATNVTNFALGSRVLIATSAFASAMVPNLTPDFIMVNPIPASYLAAGTLTYEDHFGTVLWRLSWGGASYTGPTTGAITNDADGNFGPPFDGPLPSTTAQALRFRFGASALSTNNANDYALTAGAATFTNNAAASGTVNSLVSVDPPAAGGSLALLAPAPNPVSGEMNYGVLLPRAAHVRVRVLDLSGRVVRLLVDESLAPGRHTFAWSSADRAVPALHGGVYFLELEAVGMRQTRKFVIVR